MGDLSDGEPFGMNPRVASPCTPRTHANLASRFLEMRRKTPISNRSMIDRQVMNVAHALARANVEEAQRRESVKYTHVLPPAIDDVEDTQDDEFNGALEPHMDEVNLSISRSPGFQDHVNPISGPIVSPNDLLGSNDDDLDGMIDIEEEEGASAQEVENLQLQVKELERKCSNLEYVNETRAMERMSLLSDIEKLKFEIENLKKENCLLSDTKGKSSASDEQTLVKSDKEEHADHTRQTLSDGTIAKSFSNGLVKEIWPSGHICVRFGNGDVKQKLSTGYEYYYYSSTNSLQIKHPQGFKAVFFPTGQLELYRMTSKQIIFPDGGVRYVTEEGEEIEYVLDSV